MCLINRLISLKHVQHFDAHNSNQKKKGKSGEKKYSLYIFSEHVQLNEIFQNIVNELIVNNYWHKLNASRNEA